MDCIPYYQLLQKVNVNRTHETPVNPIFVSIIFIAVHLFLKHLFLTPTNRYVR